MAGHSVGLRVVLDSKLEDYVTASRSNGFKVVYYNRLKTISIIFDHILT